MNDEKFGMLYGNHIYIIGMKGGNNMPKKDGKGPPKGSGGPRDGHGGGKGRAPGKGSGSKSGGKKGKC